MLKCDFEAREEGYIMFNSASCGYFCWLMVIGLFCELASNLKAVKEFQSYVMRY